MYSFKIYFILVNFVVDIGSNHIRNVKVHMYTCVQGICQECVNWWQEEEVNSPETLQEMCRFRSSHRRKETCRGGVTQLRALCINGRFKDKKLCLQESEKCSMAKIMTGLGGGRGGGVMVLKVSH